MEHPELLPAGMVQLELEEIDAAEQRLQEYIEKQTSIMRSMINKRHGETTEDLLRICIQAFADEVSW